MVKEEIQFVNSIDILYNMTDADLLEVIEMNYLEVFCNKLTLDLNQGSFTSNKNTA